MRVRPIPWLGECASQCFIILRQIRYQFINSGETEGMAGSGRKSELRIVRARFLAPSPTSLLRAHFNDICKNVRCSLDPIQNFQMIGWFGQRLLYVSRIFGWFRSDIRKWPIRIQCVLYGVCVIVKLLRLLLKCIQSRFKAQKNENLLPRQWMSRAVYALM